MQWSVVNIFLYLNKDAISIFHLQLWEACSTEVFFPKNLFKITLQKKAFTHKKYYTES